jgi:type II secretory pathway pseudopilin PulG
MKKAAMFGLDARIALAIFGALSVISGAALYSAIQSAKTTAFITDIREVGKAWEQYLLDTGQDLGFRTSSTHTRYTKNLIEDPGVAGWNGPYLPHKVSTTFTDLMEYTKGPYEMHVANMNTTSWSNWAAVGCTAQPDCYVWLTMGHMPASYLSTIKAVDEMIDNSDGASTGDVRYELAGGHYYIYIKYAPYQKL